jgi:hypothetical protein
MLCPTGCLQGIEVNRDQLLKEVATTGYNVLYAAKKHFATYDIVEKAPGWLTISTLGIGIFGLVIPALTNSVLSAAILLVGVAAIYFNQFQDQRQKYADAGGALISTFNTLRAIYFDVESRSPTDDLGDLNLRYQTALAEAEKVWLHKHIFLSDWYAHYKIFWQAQIDWLDAQLHFRLFRDKIPLTAMVAVVFVALGLIAWAAHAHLWRVCS